MRTSRSPLLRIAGALVLIAIALNLAGVLRYPGGPLRDRADDGPFWLDLRPADQGGIEVGSEASDVSAVGRHIFFGVLVLENPWPAGARVEAITPIDPTPDLVIDRISIGQPGATGVEVGLTPDVVLPPGVSFESVFHPLPFEIPAHATSPDAANVVLIELHGDTVGGAGFRALAIDYRVGPISFRVVQPYMLALCLGPLATGQECGWPWPRQSDG